MRILSVLLLATAALAVQRSFRGSSKNKSLIAEAEGFIAESDSTMSVRAERRKMAAIVASMNDASYELKFDAMLQAKQKDCKPGHYFHNKKCHRCPAGTYQHRSGQKHCNSCRPGSFSKGGAKRCSGCPANTYSASRACHCRAHRSCGRGQFVQIKGSSTRDNQCRSCRAGTFQSKTSHKDTSCAKCKAMTYSSAGSGSCRKCPKGSKSEVGSSGCSKCSAGTYLPPGAALGRATPRKPKFTNRPLYLVGRLGKVVQNSGNQAWTKNKNRKSWERLEIRSNGRGKYNIYSHRNKNNLQVRPDGTCHFTNKNKVTWEALDVEIHGGKLYFVSRSGTKTDGKVIQVQGNGKLVAANKNRKSWEAFTVEFEDKKPLMQGGKPASAPKCRTCAPGQFSAPGASGCTTCAPGRFSAKAGARTCAACKAGFSSSGTSTGCRKCTAGRFAAAGARCLACAPGKFSKAGAGTCTKCAVGTYAKEAGAPACVEAPIGHIVPELGESEPTICSPGTFQGKKGQSECEPCKKGFFTNAAGESECQPHTVCGSGKETKQKPTASMDRACGLCAPGRFSDSETACQDCPANTAQPKAGASSCDPCGEGLEAEGTGNTGCSKCKAGQFSDGNGGCEKCAPGTYSPKDGAEDCAECDKGTFAKESGSTKCTPCAAGRYINFMGSAKCVKCSEGSIMPYEGSPMACVECSAGTFASSATECKPCAAGKYQPDDGKSECIDVKEGHGATDIGAFTPPSQDEVRAAGADEAF